MTRSARQVALCWGYTFNGQKVALRVGGTLYYLYNDHLNTASLTTDGNGAVKYQERFDPYGTPYFQLGADVNPRGFTDQLPDSYIKLIDYGARWYDPVTGRFISPDSIVLDYSDPQSLNRYAYALNNPIKYNDPSGHCIWDACIVEGFAIGSALIMAAEATLAVGAVAIVAIMAWEAGQSEFFSPEYREGWVESFPLDPPADPKVHDSGPTLGEIIAPPVFVNPLDPPESGLGGAFQPDLETPGVDIPTFFTNRSQNKLSADPNAVGSHTTLKRDPQTGQVTGYETYIPQTNPDDPKVWETTKRFDGTGATHFNKKTQQWINTPHIHDPHALGEIREPEYWELPRGYQ